MLEKDLYYRTILTESKEDVGNKKKSSEKDICRIANISPGVDVKEPGEINVSWV